MIRNFLGLLGLVIIVVMFTGSCSTQQGQDARLVTEERLYQDELKAYRLGAGDEINLSFFDERPLSGTFELDGRGAVDLPLISEVKLGGLTAAEAVQVIKDKYSQGFLKDPKLTLRVTGYRPFYIIGEVRRPGKYGYIENLTVLEAIAMAEGFTYRANQNKIEVIRRIGRHQKSILAGTKHEVMPGDIIKVKERFF